MRSEKYEEELQSLKGIHDESELRQRVTQEKVMCDFHHLQEQINRLKVTERRFIAVEETLQNLHDELLKSEYLWK